jgi:hypothetical protein
MTKRKGQVYLMLRRFGICQQHGLGSEKGTYRNRNRAFSPHGKKTKLNALTGPELVKGCHLIRSINIENVFLDD